MFRFVAVRRPRGSQFGPLLPLVLKFAGSSGCARERRRGLVDHADGFHHDKDVLVVASTAFSEAKGDEKPNFGVCRH